MWTVRKQIYLFLVISVVFLLLLNYYVPFRGVYEELKIITHNPHKLRSQSSYPVPSDRRIALCISGQFRWIDKILENHRTLLDLHPDVFIYAEADLDTKSRNQVYQFYQPKAIVWDSEVVAPQNRLSVNNVKMFKRIYQCDQLRQKFEKDNAFEYDMVIRMRPDTVFYGPFPHRVLQKPLLEQRVYFPMRTKHEPLIYGLPDMVFWGNSRVMKQMCECYLYLDELKKVDICTNEYIFMNYMIKRNLIGRKIEFKLNNFDRSIHMGVKFIDKYIKSKSQYLKNGLECYSNNDYKKLIIEDND